LQHAGEQADADVGLWTELSEHSKRPASICRSQDPNLRAETLNQTGKQLIHIGEYQTALDYLKQSLAICQEIGDAAGLCTSLFNLGYLYLQNDEPAEAVRAWVTAYRQARSMGLKEIINALGSPLNSGYRGDWMPGRHWRNRWMQRPGVTTQHRFEANAIKLSVTERQKMRGNDESRESTRMDSRQFA